MRLTEDPVMISGSTTRVVVDVFVSLRKTDENLEREKYLFGFLLMNVWACEFEGNSLV